MIPIFPEPFWFLSHAQVFSFAGALAHNESAARTIWWALVLNKGMVVEVMIHLVLGRTGARVPPELTRCGSKKIINPSEGNGCAAAVLTYADWSAYLSGRSLLPFPRLASLFRYGADYVWSLSLSRNDCCCILQPNEQRCAPVKAACRSGSGPSWHLSARQLREWKQLGKRVSLCSLYGGGSEM